MGFVLQQWSKEVIRSGRHIRPDIKGCRTTLKQKKKKKKKKIKNIELLEMGRTVFFCN